ncbi:MAG: replicative DNA helicase, partial [Bacteroidales bacterium]
MFEKSAAEKGVLLLETDMFYKTEHQFVFEAIASAISRLKACDILLVTQEMMRLDSERTIAMNGAYFVTLLSSRIASVGNFDHHVLIVKEKYLMREFIRRSSEMISSAYDESTDPEELITDLQKLNGFMMQQMYAQERTLGMKDLIQQVFDKYYQRQARSSGNELPGITSGIDKLDYLIGGWDQSTLNVIAARPGMGKTSFILHLALQAVRKEKKALIFSLEMDAAQIGGRILQGQSGVDAGEFRLGILDDTGIRTLETVSDTLMDLPLYINDTPLQSIAQ